jgi:hypothetical protein
MNRKDLQFIFHKKKRVALDKVPATIATVHHFSPITKNFNYLISLHKNRAK